MQYLNLEEENLSLVTDELNTLLSSFNVYYQNLRNFHWNIKGENFFDLHDQFEYLYTEALVKIDEIAERILVLGFRPLSNFSSFLQRSNVSEPDGIYTDYEMIEFIIGDHRALIDTMRKTIQHASAANDEGTVDLIAGFLREIEKESWKLQSWATKLVLAQEMHN